MKLSKARARRDLRRQRAKTQRQIQRIEGRTSRRVARVDRSYSKASQQISNTSLKGLKGRYRKEVQTEIARSQPELANAKRHHMKLYEREGRQLIRPLRQGLREETATLAGQYFETLRDRALDARQERTEARQERGEAREERIGDALETAADHWVALREASRPVPQSKQDWLLFQQALEQQNPLMSPQVAARAVAQLSARLATQEALPPGVAGPTIREARPNVRRRLRRSIARDYLRG